jgi:hypothetical protein
VELEGGTLEVACVYFFEESAFGEISFSAVVAEGDEGVELPWLERHFDKFTYSSLKRPHVFQKRLIALLHRPSRVGIELSPVMMSMAPTNRENSSRAMVRLIIIANFLQTAFVVLD